MEAERPLKAPRLESAAVSAAEPCGPRSMEESDLWPDRFLSMMHQVGCLRFFLNQIFEGLHLTTDFSGIGTAEEACRCLVKAAVKREAQNARVGLDVVEEESLAESLLFVQRSGDKDATCRVELRMQQEVLGVQHCVHGDIGERCNLDLWDHVTFQVKIMQE